MTQSDAKGLTKLGRTIALPVSCGLALLCVTLWAPSAQAYPYYKDGFGEGCVECHAGFEGGGGNLLHAVHTSNFGVTTCNLCHPSGPGSKPVATYTSGTGGGFGCAGCHGRDYGETSPNSGQPKATGYGLRQVHADAGVTECATCHQPGLLGHPNPFPVILGENVAPVYYGMSSNNLKDPCSSVQEDSTFDVDAIGLDNDGDGTIDFPADSDCPTTTTTTTLPTTTTTTTTTTTLPVQCALAPVGGCVDPAKGILLVNEKSAGREKLKVALKKLQPAVTQGDFGDPVGGGTSYAICIYDELDQLIGEMSVARAGDGCGSPAKPCFKAVKTKGFKYRDKLTAADGILKMVMVGGDPGKGKLVVVGKNKAAKGQTSLPTGIAPLLQDNGLATVQLLTSDAACFGSAVTQVKKADGAVFKAIGP